MAKLCLQLQQDNRQTVSWQKETGYMPSHTVLLPNLIAVHDIHRTPDVNLTFVTEFHQVYTKLCEGANLSCNLVQRISIAASDMRTLPLHLKL